MQVRETFSKTTQLYNANKFRILGVQKNEVQVFGTNYISRTYDVGDVQNKD